MVKFQFKYLYFMVCIVIAILIAPYSYGSASIKSLDKLLVLSGLTDQIEQFPKLMKEGMQGAKGESSSLSDSAYTLILASIDQTILPSAIIVIVREALSIELSSTGAEQLLKWYESDLGRQITQAEADSSTADADNKILALESQLLANTERLGFAQRFDQLLGATDMNVELQKHSSVAIFSAMMTAAHPEQIVDISPFVDQIEALSEASRPVIKNDIMLAFIYAYQDIETKKLEKYESFLNEESSKKFNRIVVKSMSTAIELSISKWATSLASIFQHKGATAL
mgnify:FL=1|jgi:hypothetical protein